MLDATAEGVYVIAVTPFQDDGRLDEASTDRVVDFYLRCGVTGMTILGIMGEALKLDAAEAIGFARRVVKRAGRLPVVVGVSSPGFASMRTLARSAMEAGAAGVMIAPPASVRTDDQIVGYFAQAVEAIGADVPFVIQDYPQASGVVMAPAVIRRIVEAHAVLRHAQARGMAGAGEDHGRARASGGGRDAAHLDPHRQRRHSSSTSRWSAGPTAP